ncbi:MULTISPECIES: HAMP domain-containing sensor histidine kinase [Luteimonas]|uniref:histidine kinase n=1 Tax=Luteimonas chenhongjianii TaxID=2006110 RepID=A0A290XCW6_9GAMM|nr:MULTISPECIES: HAMP domain-containing sensor histidine kinase [Luteimonas]ATD67004.1 two-component sensor histidine kinase [Luteimonas chenhongjianii]RPD84408.1 sensor histidine kinase [Luteimonas sp. 100069]
MPQGLPNRIRDAFTFQAVIAGLTLIVCVMTAAFIGREVVARQWLRAEADVWWQARGTDVAYPPPFGVNLQGYFVPDDGSALQSIVGAERAMGSVVRFKDAPEGFSPRSDTEGVLLVDRRPGGTLYLAASLSLFDRILALAAGALALLMMATMFVVSWMTYRTSRRIVLPIHRLADEVARWNPSDDGDGVPPPLSTREDTGREARALTSALLGLGERISAFVRREREFTRDASHELRTPLTVIRVASDMIASDPATPPHQQRPLLRIRRATQDMEAVIDALLVLARERGVMPQSEIFGVVEVVEEELDKVRPLFEGKHLTLELDVQARPRLDAPPRVLGVMLGHLLRNAWAFTETGGVAVIVMNDRIIVRDSGIGMTADVLKRVYDPFYRADPFSQSGKGIGLSIVRRLGTRFGWPVALESAAGEGTTVTVVFRDRLV